MTLYSAVFDCCLPPGAGWQHAVTARHHVARYLGNQCL